MIQIISLLGLLLVFTEVALVVPSVLGHALGSYLAVRKADP